MELKLLMVLPAEAVSGFSTELPGATLTVGLPKTWLFDFSAMKALPSSLPIKSFLALSARVYFYYLQRTWNDMPSLPVFPKARR